MEAYDGLFSTSFEDILKNYQKTCWDCSLCYEYNFEEKENKNNIKNNFFCHILEKVKDKEIKVEGWIRLHRDQKTFGFIDFQMAQLLNIYKLFMMRN